MSITIAADGVSQQRVTDTTTTGLDLFGADISSNAASYFASGLKGRPDESLYEELARSREELGTLTGQEVGGFAYPYGYHDTRVKRAVQHAGYSYGCTCSNCFKNETAS